MDAPTTGAPPIFVVGTPRSGTSLAAKILGRHPNIFMPEETPFFHDVYSRRNSFGDLRDPGATERVVERLGTLYGRYHQMRDQRRVDGLLKDPAVRARLRAATSYRELLVAFMEAQMKLVGGIRWGNQLPKDIYHVDQVLEFFPDAKFVVCARDVRDFLLSYKLKWQSTAPDNVDRLKRLYHPVVTSLLWRSTVKRFRRVQKSIPEENCIFVPYERMVTAPGRTVQEICDLVGEEFVPQMLELEFSNSSVVRTRRGIDARSVGTWRKGLAPEEAWIAQRVAGSEMSALGYEAETIPLNIVRLGVRLLTTPFAFARALHANRRTRGPLFIYLARRLRPLFERE